VLPREVDAGGGLHIPWIVAYTVNGKGSPVIPKADDMFFQSRVCTEGGKLSLTVNSTLYCDMTVECENSKPRKTSIARQRHIKYISR
jgi:hypothetical protein